MTWRQVRAWNFVFVHTILANKGDADSDLLKASKYSTYSANDLRLNSFILRLNC